MSADNNKIAEPAINIPENDGSPSSEVGSEQRPSPVQVPGVHAVNNSTKEPWQIIMETQNRALLELVSGMMRSSQSQPGRSFFTLPDFDPDKTDSDARGWCATVDLCMKDNLISGSSLIIALSQALKGSASKWFSLVSFEGMTWSQFKDIFIAEYDNFETPAASLLNLHNTLSYPRRGYG
ncbi:Hypothetical protein NTJ_15977 [Nesidiocoris tenuis]|uniref:Retrotransposon gag domain-containing protein n=1 Tax=Nesidiocoris tenuis TaxID=355587 RepID=A0ABN7BFS0_9HEMI|nr:Hypothetical protein NTJ_15977 [Nesidiocoris tenuis]